MPRRALAAAACLLLAGGIALGQGNDLLIALEGGGESVSHGTPADGWLENGVRLPASGPNFRAYSDAAVLAGRACVHSRVRDLVAAAYGRLAEERPQTTYIYGETGWCAGGPFPPHKTHQNGLSVDFMVPVTRGGEPAELPTGAHLRFGYDNEFDSKGRMGEYAIDYAAIAAHLAALRDLAAAHKLGIERVIFATDLQGALKKAGGEALSGLAFNKTQTWVRHDDHYHVDFAVR